MMDREKRLRLGSRSSALARVQAEGVAELLRRAHSGLEIELIYIQTSADRAPHLPLNVMGDKALWVADLEQSLLSGTIDLAVHSMKDVPADLPDGLHIASVPERECALDALALPASHPGGHSSLVDLAHVTSAIYAPAVQEALSKLLPDGARIGTSSDRRRGQLLLWRPDLQIEPVRGNVDSRLRKLDAGEHDALVLAAAGLRRLGLGHRISGLFPSRRLLPAAGQGALALESRVSDERVNQLLAPLNHGPTRAAVTAERAFVRAVGGGCSVPLGVYTTFPEGCMELWVRAAVPRPTPGSPPPLQDLEIAVLPDLDPFGDLGWAEDLGRRVAARFLANGGAAFVQAQKGQEL